MRSSFVAAGLAAAALAGAAGTAAAADYTYVPVPAGKIEHTVELIDFTASYTVPGTVPRHERVERWIGRDRAREVHTDTTTGERTHECVADAVRTRCWNPSDGIYDVGPGPSGGPQSRWQTRDGDAEWLRQTIAEGWYAQSGDTTHDGLPAAVYHSTDALPSMVDQLDAELVVDPQTLHLWSETVSFSHRGASGTQTRVYTVDEMLDDSAVPAFRMLTAVAAHKSRACKHTKKHKKACRKARKRGAHR